MTGIRSALRTLMPLAFLGAFADEARAQAWSFDVAFDQSFTSLDPLPSPTGFAVAAGGIRLWGPLGLEATLRSVSDPGGTVAQSCGFASCTPGPFEVSHTMRTLGLGLSYDFVNPVDVWLTLVFSGAASWHVEGHRHAQTGERTTLDSGGADLGVATAAHLRLRPILLGLRPEISLHYDHVFAGDCEADGSCWPSRDVFGLSAGFGWVFGAVGGS